MTAQALKMFFSVWRWFQVCQSHPLLGWVRGQVRMVMIGAQQVLLVGTLLILLPPMIPCSSHKSQTSHTLPPGTSHTLPPGLPPPALPSGMFPPTPPTPMPPLTLLTGMSLLAPPIPMPTFPMPPTVPPGMPTVPPGTDPPLGLSLPPGINPPSTLPHNPTSPPLQPGLL